MALRLSHLSFGRDDLRDHRSASICACKSAMKKEIVMEALRVFRAYQSSLYSNVTTIDNRLERSEEGQIDKRQALADIDEAIEWIDTNIKDDDSGNVSTRQRPPS
jgi:hypothetical protein